MSSSALVTQLKEATENKLGLIHFKRNGKVHSLKTPEFEQCYRCIFLKFRTGIMIDRETDCHDIFL